ncbi:MAG: hypothetical protein ABI016_02985 [Chthoniobacterales bacterium]
MSFRLAVLLLLGTFVLLFAPVLFRAEVIFPHGNELETNVPEEKAPGRIFNRKFSDASSVFIPELANNLNSRHKAWLNTWNPHVELGRPAIQVSGLSRAGLLTNLLAAFTLDPFVVYTTLVLLTIGLTSVFALLFFRALGLHPAASAAAALGLGFTSALTYWLTFVMFLSTICWSVCLLWLVTEFTRRGTWAVALGLAFAAYSLLLTGYPQMTILFVLMAGLYTLIRLAQMEASPKEKIWRALQLLGCAMAGGLAALPIYLDLLAGALDSARLNGVEDSFFLAVLPPHGGLREIVGFVATIFDWSWLGNAIAPTFPQAFNGLSFTPIFGSLIWLTFLLKPRPDLCFWQLFLLVCLAGTIFPALYLFAVHHLGFGFSRIQLLCGGIVPGFVLSAYAIDAVLQGNFRLTIARAGWLLLPLAGEILVALIIWRSISLSSFAIAATLLLVLGLVAAIVWRSIPGFVGLALLSVFLYGRPLLLSRPPSEIHRSSALIEVLQQKAAGARFAIADPGMKAILPPNQEALFSLRSINSYDSLSPRRYQELVGLWSAKGAVTYGRHFKTIDPKLALADPGFRLADVSVVLSAQTLPSAEWTEITEVDGIRLYRPMIVPVSLLQTGSYKVTGRDEIQIDPSGQAMPSRRLVQRDDFQKIQVSASPHETLLFVSQQYHRAWQAMANQRRLQTVLVNRFYQGVIVPPMTREVELVFRPFALWSWVAQVLFGAGAALLFVGRFLHLGPAKTIHRG